MLLCSVHGRSVRLKVHVSAGRRTKTTPPIAICLRRASFCSGWQPSWGWLLDATWHSTAGNTKLWQCHQQVQATLHACICDALPSQCASAQPSLTLVCEGLNWSDRQLAVCQACSAVLHCARANSASQVFT